MTYAMESMSIERVQEALDDEGKRYQIVRILTTVICDLVCITPLN